MAGSGAKPGEASATPVTVKGAFPVSVIRTPYIEETGTKSGPLARWMLRGHRTKRWMRTIYGLQSVWKLKRSSLRAFSYRDYLQAGKSVAGIERIEPAGEIVRRFRAAAESPSREPSGLAVEHCPAVTHQL